MMPFHAVLFKFGAKWWNQLSSPVTMFSGKLLLSVARLSRRYKNTSLCPFLCLSIRMYTSTNFPVSQN
jgi:hypothetical protein